MYFENSNSNEFIIKKRPLFEGILTLNGKSNIPKTKTYTFLSDLDSPNFTNGFLARAVIT